MEEGTTERLLKNQQQENFKQRMVKRCGTKKRVEKNETWNTHAHTYIHTHDLGKSVMIAIEASWKTKKGNNGISTKTTMILIARVEETGKSGKNGESRMNKRELCCWVVVAADEEEWWWSEHHNDDDDDDDDDDDRKLGVDRLDIGADYTQ